MIDHALELSEYLPNGGGSFTLSLLDIGVDITPFSNQWRQGRLRVSLASAMPNFISNADTITAQIYDSVDAGATFQAVNPSIFANFTGQANGTNAGAYVDMPFPPGLRGPVAVVVTVPAGVNTLDPNGNPCLLVVNYCNE